MRMSVIDKRKNTYYVTVNYKNKKDKYIHVPCGTRYGIVDMITALNSQGIKSYTFTLYKNGLRYKEFNLVKSMLDFIKFIPLIKEEQ